jgi:transposase
LDLAYKNFLNYFLSFVVEVEPSLTSAKSQSIGIDLGIKTFAVMSNGEKVQSPDYSKKVRPQNSQVTVKISTVSERLKEKK